MGGGGQAERRRGAATMSGQVKSLETAFGILNRALFDGALSKSVITISPTPRAYGHFTPWKSWESAEGGKFCEINLGAEALDRPIVSTIATLVHEMVHQWCYEHDVKDTSRGGRYHNKSFKVEAEKRGLEISYDKRIGWSVTRPGEALLVMQRQGAFEGCEMELHRLGARMNGGGAQGKAKSSTRKYVCPSCGMSVRATKEVNVLCGGCRERMLEADR